MEIAHKNTIFRKPLYGYFSASQFQKYGGYLYRHVNGTHVLVTSIYSNSMNGYEFMPDEKYVGLVEEFISIKISSNL